jgi:DNA modification methylase
MADEPGKFDLRSGDIAEDKKQELLRLFPEIRTEGGKLDFERLKLTLGEAVDVGKERYGMNWPGKADCFRTIQAPSLGTLRPCQKESVNFDTTENLIIEGDNLEVLKLLQKSYLGKVKMIYIDPPYNTGNDFIYPDNYTESLQTYLQYTGQVDAEGRKFGTNTDADGRFHSKWLNMVYPRLYLARNLLRDDGVIFITVDDHEVHNLRVLMNVIFGDENFVATCVWQKRYSRENRGSIGDTHDYILVYALNAESFQASRGLIPIYDTPKPVRLVRRMLEIAADRGSVVLDFFAGSGTTAHAVLDLNRHDSGRRKFILVQLPEPTGREDYPTIADITKERVRRVIKMLNDEDAAKLDLVDAKKQDRGVRVFKLAESNLLPWNADAPHDPAALEDQLELHIHHIREGRTTQDLLYELLLKSGFPLTTSVEPLTLAGKAVHSVAGGALLICLERELTLDLIRAIAEKKPERVVCLDEGFAGNDQLKANAVQIFKTKGVTSFKTV